MDNGSSPEVESEAEHQSRLFSVHSELVYEVNRATSLLAWLLSGIETMRTWYGDSSDGTLPPLSYLPTKPWLHGASIHDVLKREGEAEQMAFKGWVEQVYQLVWDSDIRNKFYAHFKRTPNDGTIIRPQMDAFGDFRLIRDDLIHNGEIASDEKTGKCIVLKWFMPGDKIVLGMRHLLDFYNQAGLIKTTTNNVEFLSGWIPHVESDPVPNIVSIRTEPFRMDNPEQQPVILVALVFEDGVYANIPCPWMDPENEHTWQEVQDTAKNITIDANGNLRFPNGFVKDRASIYTDAFKAIRGEFPKIDGLGGVPSPWMRFAK